MPHHFKKTLCLGLFATSMVINSSYAANPQPSGQVAADQLLDRPKWLPAPPEINTGGFSTDSTVYNEMRKKALDKKDKTAIKTLHQLAMRGHVNSMVLLGYLSDNDLKLMPLNSNNAAKYWAVAARAGDGIAIYNLGILYLNGRGVPQNLDTAKTLFNLAAEKGVPRGYYLSGQLLEKAGKYTDAINIYKRCSSVRSLPQCKTRYGILSITRTRLSPTEANLVVNQLNEAGQYGDLEAFYTLARLSAEGIVINKSMPAMVFYLEAMVNFPNSTIAYKKLALNMYKTYKPSDTDINLGKRNFQAGFAGVGYVKVKTMIDVKRTILDNDTY